MSVFPTQLQPVQEIKTSLSAVVPNVGVLGRTVRDI